MELPEFLLKLFTVIILIIGILGLMMQDMSFSGTIGVLKDERASIDLGHAVLSADCLVETINGEIRKGKFDYFKLNKYDGKEDFCLEFDGKYYIIIKTSDKQWEIGNDFTGGNGKQFPATIKQEDKIIPGELIVKVKL